MEKFLLLAIFSLLVGTASAYADDGECGYPVFKEEIAGELANQLAEKSWDEHKDEFVKPTPIKSRKMPFTLSDKDELATFIEDILLKRAKASKDGQSDMAVLDPHKDDLADGRSAWWENKTGTVVIHDPENEDCGSAFRPTSGKKYYDDLT